MSRSISGLLHRAATPTIQSRICLYHLRFRPNLQPSTKILQRQLFSDASWSASARFAPRPAPRPKHHPPPPPPEAEMETEYHIPMPEKKTKEPGNGLIKLFLVITIPILFLSHADEIARFSVPPDEVRKALNLDPNAKPSPEAYDYYIYNNKPDLGLWLKMGQVMKKNFSFIPANFAGNTPGEPFRWWTLLTSEFNHGGVLHLLFCYTALKVFAPSLVRMYGGGVTTTCFLAGGVIAELFAGLYERATNPFLEMSPAEVKQRSKAGFTKEEKRLYHNAYSYHLGSSTSLMTLGTLCAIVHPSMSLNLMFIPIAIPIRTAIGAFAAFDLGGMIWGYGLPIGHSGHIGGVIAGLVLYQFWIRRLPTTMQRRLKQMLREKGINI